MSFSRPTSRTTTPAIRDYSISSTSPMAHPILSNLTIDDMIKFLANPDDIQELGHLCPEGMHGNLQLLDHIAHTVRHHKDSIQQIRENVRYQKRIGTNVLRNLLARGFENHAASFLQEKRNSTVNELQFDPTPLIIPTEQPPIGKPGSRTNPIVIIPTVNNIRLPQIATRIHRRMPTPGPNVVRSRNPNTKCYKCTRLGHIKQHCPQYQCFHCKRYAPGHISRICNNRSRRAESSNESWDDHMDDEGYANVTGEPHDY
jgi:hypothetical protein